MLPLVLALSVAASCCEPEQSPQERLPAAVDVGSSAALGGLAAELVVLGIVGFIVRDASALDGAGQNAMLALVAIVWPLGSGGYATERAVERNVKSPYLVGFVAFAVSAVTFWGGILAASLASGVPIAGESDADCGQVLVFVGASAVAMMGSALVTGTSAALATAIVGTE